MKLNRDDISWWGILLLAVLILVFAGLGEYVSLLFKVKVLRSLGVGI